jgi:hypothetical protein
MKTTTLIRATVEPEHAERNRVVRGVYAAFEATQPDGSHYATLESDDGLSVIHLYSQDYDDAAGLHELAAFRAPIWKAHAGDRTRCADDRRAREACRHARPA